MRLELNRYQVRDLRLLPAGAPRLEGGTLLVGEADLVAALQQHSGLDRIQVDLVKPGDSARIIHVLDVVQPRVKVKGRGTVFPGFLGAGTATGEGCTHVLDGMAVVETGLLGIHEGIIEMSGTGAPYSPFAGLFHLVLSADRPAEMSDREYDQALRLAGLQAAAYLAEATRGLEPDRAEVCELSPVDPALPRVGCMYFLQSQGDTRDTFLYGSDARRLVPTLLHPNEVFDGALVSGNYVIASQKNPTYMHQENPVLQELYRRHGKDLCFAGVIIANQHSTAAEKFTTAEFAAKLGRLLNLQGVVISKEGGGNAYTDVMMACESMEQAGIRTTMIMNELAGQSGELPSLADWNRFADAMVSTGNNDAVIPLSRVDRVVGGTQLRSVSGPPADAGNFPLGLIYGATNQFGWTTLRAVQY